MFKEFKQFAIKGNVMDLAVGVIIGGAFGKIVESLVSDLIMPVISVLIGHLDFSGYFWVLGSGFCARYGPKNLRGDAQGGCTGFVLRQLHHHRH